MEAALRDRLCQIQRGEIPEGYTKNQEGFYPSDWVVKKCVNGSPL